MRQFEHRHVVTFEDTNVVGNVYFARYLSWQGSCREMFLRDHAPEVFAHLATDFALVTVRCSCEFFDELRVSDEVLVAMTLREIRQNRVVMGFEYMRIWPGRPTVVARGEQEVACMRRTEGVLRPDPIPDVLRRALEAYAGDRSLESTAP